MVNQRNKVEDRLLLHQMDSCSYKEKEDLCLAHQLFSAQGPLVPLPPLKYLKPWKTLRAMKAMVSWNIMGHLVIDREIVITLRTLHLEMPNNFKWNSH